MNEPKPQDYQNLIKNLLAVAPKHCDNCGNRYIEDDFRIIKNSKMLTVFHLKCSKCNNAYMLNVMSAVNGMVGAQRLPVNTDLDKGEELQKFAGKPAVNKDEAIDIFNSLRADTKQGQIIKLTN